MSLMARHRILETNSILLIIGILLVIAIGGIFEIAPLFYLKSTIEKVEGMRPYTPLELAGRRAPVARDEDVRVVLRVPESDREGLAVARGGERPVRRARRDEVERRGVHGDLQARLAQARGGRLQRVVAGRHRLGGPASGQAEDGGERRERPRAKEHDGPRL